LGESQRQQTGAQGRNQGQAGAREHDGQCITGQAGGQPGDGPEARFSISNRTRNQVQSNIER
jgi:hypothetical protein